MNRIMAISDILKNISKIKDPDQRKLELTKHQNNKALMTVLQAAYHPAIKFLLPEGTPPFKKLQKSQDAEGSLYREARKFYIFIEGQTPNISQLKRETLFIQLLEALDPDDAELILGMKDKKIIYPGLTYEFVHSTFPDLIPDPEQKKLMEDKEKPKNPKVRKAVPCPFGCKSSNQDGLFAINTLGLHLRRVHGSSNEEAEQDNVTQ
jgi:hypothetical protein